MDAATRAWLLDQLGTATDLADLEDRYTRLGSARAVALSVLRTRRAALLAQPAKVSVTGVVNVDYAEIIKALERQITELESGRPLAPDESDPDGDGTVGETMHPIHLIPRRRR